SAPKFSQIVIGDDGYPARMVAPDPRAFALHKFWVSQQPDRDPLKKGRDKNQAISAAQLVIEYLPQYRFGKNQLKMFPQTIVNKFYEVLDKEDFSF
ncbi:MAG: GSU2403 family nucleotidyltransferase fold protein, partial [Thermodesulfobacteriota bacterium]|nr:GSU2403 family nucleotidyltransferase fold protein [Thermodesulfobacteriota bacterium]